MTDLLERAALLRWRNAVFATFFSMGCIFSAWLSRVPHVRNLLDASTADMGVILMGISIGSVTGLLLAAQVVHWFGSHRAPYGMIVVAAGLAIAGWGSEAGLAWLVMGGFVVCGLLVGITDVAMNISGAAN